MSDFPTGNVSPSAGFRRGKLNGIEYDALRKNWAQLLRQLGSVDIADAIAVDQADVWSNLGQTSPFDGRCCPAKNFLGIIVSQLDIKERKVLVCLTETQDGQGYWA